MIYSNIIRIASINLKNKTIGTVAAINDAFPFLNSKIILQISSSSFLTALLYKHHWLATLLLFG